MKSIFRKLWGIVLIAQCLYGYAFALDSLTTQTTTRESTIEKDLLNTLLALPIYTTQQWHTLLHYGKYKSSIHKKSSFFLHNKGYNNPKSEYEETLQRLFIQNPTKSSQDSIACIYPARMAFVKRYITQHANIYSINEAQLRFFDDITDINKCADLQDFLDIVPLEKVFIEFAAESDTIPGSSMGHLYLHLQGVMKKDIQRVFENTPFERTKGQTQDYAMSYYATMSEWFNPLDYIRAIAGNLKGYYALAPYANVSTQYLSEHNRSIYRYEVKANKEDLALFALHLWELKDKQIAYSFIKHNCTNGIEKILGVLDFANSYRSKKHFSTPVQYLQYLDSKGKISLNEVLLPKRKKSFVEKFGANKILQSYKNSKISISYSYPNVAFLSFYPIYSDIKNADNSYKEFIESRLASLQAGVAVLKDSTNNNYARGFLSNIELLHLHSINDFIRTRTLSKLISISFKPNLYNYDKNTKIYTKEPNYQTRLYPNIELGIGFGAYVGNAKSSIAFFTLPFFSYRYEIIHNPSLALKSGIVARIPRLRIMLDYTLYYDAIKNNRGFDSKLLGFLGISVYKNVDLFVECAYYQNLFFPHNYTYGRQILYQKEEFLELKSGISVNF